MTIYQRKVFPKCSREDGHSYAALKGSRPAQPDGGIFLPAHFVKMARNIPMWPCRPTWPCDGPYLYDGEFYYDKKGGKPCKTMKEAYRERYKVLIHNNAMPPSPSYSTNTGTGIAIAFIAFVIATALIIGVLG